ncbi:MAG: Zn-dependent hydrolase [Anaerolineales bacterium]|nr:Zn-dependent hydrolase [Anaerolineales bacterium]
MDTKIQINSLRLKRDFDVLSAIGADEFGGVDRPTFSAAHLAVREWFRQRILQDGLEFSLDGAGNHSAILRSRQAQAKTLLLGSHLDSVPHGGRYDGALGVLAALEVLRTIQEANLSLPVHLEAIDFTDEEGTLYGLLGSAALAGLLEPEALLAPRGGRAALLEGLQRAGLSEEGFYQARREPDSLAGYLELHIEQGPCLEQAGVQIGVVTTIVRITSYRLTFLGRADHAGTTPMLDRLDAAQGACAFTLQARQMVLERFSSCVVNVGEMHFSPGAFNIVPGSASLALEFRAPDETTFASLEASLMELAQSAAENYGLKLEREFLGRHHPTPMHETAQQAIQRAAGSSGLSWLSLPSGAGHDAQSLAQICPAGMIFVPSVEGASHSGREYTHWEDCVNGANVLLQAALSLAAV